MDNKTGENNRPIDLSFKVVLLGEFGVGKTSIISRYIHNTFSSNGISTLGSCITSKTIYFKNVHKNVKFEIWDTAGQEKYKAITKIFYKDSAIAILVYDISRKQSLDEIKNYWIEHLKVFSPGNLVIALVANKSDLNENEEIDENVGREYAKEIGAIFRKTSAKDGTGIEELFEIIGNKVLDPNYKDE